MRGNVFPRGVRFGGKQLVHDDGLLFAGAAAHVRADGFRGNVLRGAMQPAGQHPAIGDSSGAFREGNEHPLRHVLGQVRIGYHPHRSGMDQVHVPAHQFSERRFGAGFGPGVQQL